MTSRPQTTPAQKAKIISEIIESGKSISEIAKAYGLSAQQLGSWKNHYIKLQKQLLSIKKESKFVEVIPRVEPIKTTILKKVDLEFNNYSLSISGKLESTQLISIIKILEESCSQ